MSKLYLLRHFQSQWNKENRFTGWIDVPLSKEGKAQVKEVAKKIADIKLDSIYTSPLNRNQNSVLRILEEIGLKYPIFIHLEGKMKEWGRFIELNKEYFPVFVSEKLNERYYGKLQGLNKEEMMKKYGKEKVQLWRRSFSVRPPGGESLKDTLARVAPFYANYIKKDLKEGKTILVVASGNSLRALVKYVEKVSDEEITKYEIPPATLIQYQLDKDLKLQYKKVL